MSVMTHFIEIVTKSILKLRNEKETVEVSNAHNEKRLTDIKRAY